MTLNKLLASEVIVNEFTIIDSERADYIAITDSEFAKQPHYDFDWLLHLLNDSEGKHLLFRKAKLHATASGVIIVSLTKRRYT